MGADKFDKDDDDSRYLAGAVPEVDGSGWAANSVFPVASQDEIYRTDAQVGFIGRMAQNKNNSRVVYKDQVSACRKLARVAGIQLYRSSSDRTWLDFIKYR